MRHYLIDGYNLIFQVPELRKLLEQDLERAREILLRQLASYAAAQSVELLVVFDGDNKTSGPFPGRNRVKILFSKYPEKADPLIKRLIDELGSRADWTVVSSDNEIANYARLYGIKSVTSRKFASEFNTPHDATLERKFDNALSQDELEEWLQLFQKKQNGE